MITLLMQLSVMHWKAKCTKKFWEEIVLLIVEMLAFKRTVEINY
jgi:hypothetical protein